MGTSYIFPFGACVFAAELRIIEGTSSQPILWSLAASPSLFFRQIFKFEALLFAFASVWCFPSAVHGSEHGVAPLLHSADTKVQTCPGSRESLSPSSCCCSQFWMKLFLCCKVCVFGVFKVPHLSLHYNMPPPSPCLFDPVSFHSTFTLSCSPLHSIHEYISQFKPTPPPPFPCGTKLIEDDWFFPGCSDSALETRQQELEEELAQARGLGQHRAKKLAGPSQRSLQVRLRLW